jgi:chemotaxis protein CheD
MIRVRNISHHPAQTPATQQGKVHPSLQERVRVYTGDVATTTRPTILEALLGSCVAVCLYDPRLRAGGMNHILLPGGCPDCTGTRFGVHAMELLINELMKQGAIRKRLVAKAFGGANVLAGLVTATIGDDNARFVREFLSTENIPLVAERLGGDKAVQVKFSTDTGTAVVHTVDGSRLPKIVHAEASYWRTHHADTYLSGDITLF